MSVKYWDGPKAARAANALRLIAEAEAQNLQQIQDWYAISSAVRNGLAPTFLPIGTQIEDTWKESASSAEYTVPWDVVHHYANGDMALKWHYTTPTAIPFDAPEAVYYAEDVLPAGQYYITIGSDYGTGWVKNQNINFTLSADMAVGDQLVIATAESNATNPTNGRTWNVYAKGSTTSKQTGTTSNSTSGSYLGTIGAESNAKPNGAFNAIQRVVYGSGRWSQSAWRQWANSEGDVGAWWVAMNPWDRPPAVAATMRGFLAGCSPDFVAVLKPVPVVTALNTVEGYADATETTYDRIFLPSLTQRYAIPQYAEDEPWDYFKILAEQAGRVGRYPTGSSYSFDEIKDYSIADHSSAVHSRLRSAYRSSAHYTWNINSPGYFIGGSGASNAFRGCPACILQSA